MRHDLSPTAQHVVAGVGALTLLISGLSALTQRDIKRVLAYSTISQIGYMIFGLALFTTNALAGSIFYIVHHIIVRTNLFLVSGAVQRLRSSCAGMLQDRKKPEEQR